MSQRAKVPQLCGATKYMEEFSLDSVLPNYSTASESAPQPLQPTDFISVIL